MGSFNKADARISNLSETINMFVETTGEGASSTSVLKSVYGTEVLIDLGNVGKCRGLYQASRSWTGVPILFAVFGEKVYVIDNVDGGYVATVIGNVNNEDHPVSMTETGGEGSAHPHIVIADGKQLYAVDTTLMPGEMQSDYRSISLPYRVVQEDKERPTVRIEPSHVCYCKNFILVNDAGTDAFYTSYEFPFERETPQGAIDYDIFMINSTRTTEISYKDYGFITYAEWCPDNITAIYSNKTYLYTFGPKSTQLFTSTNDIDAPFNSPTNCANGIGIKAVYSLASVGDYLFFLGASDIGENGLYYWKDNTLTRFSNPDIECLISKFTNTQDAIGQCWQENGHIFYGITFIKDKYTLVYDVLEGLWHRRSTRGATTNEHGAWRVNFARLHEGRLCFGTVDGKIVYMKPDKYDEYDGRPLIRLRRSGCLVNNYQYFSVDCIEVICNTGDFNGSIGKIPQIMMRYSDKGGPWSNQQLAFMGNQGDYDWTCCWWKLGLHKIMCVEVSCSDPVNFCIVGGKIRYSLMDI